MDVGDLGEFGLIERIERLAREVQGRDVVLGIGDDAAILRPRPREDVVVTTDAARAGIHFRFDQETPRTAGARAAAAALSDLAAMGARPLGATLALDVPPRAPLREVLGLVRGLLGVCAAAGCPLVGGNVSRGRELGLTTTAVGAVRRGAALRRDRARAGDRVWVTGTLGRSALERARGRVRHVPEARLAAGRALARLRGVGACIDVSDGLLADLGHVACASGVRLVLRPDLAAQLMSRGVSQPAARLGLGLRAAPLVLSGGEDYELLIHDAAGERLRGRRSSAVSACP